MMVVSAASITTSATPASSSLPMRMIAVDDDVDMQAVIGENDVVGRIHLAAKPSQLGRIGEAGPGAAGEIHHQPAVIDAVARDIGMRGAKQRGGIVEKLPRPGDHLLAAHRVVAAGTRRAALFGDGIGPVKRIIERAPAGIGGVERIARVHHRHHELRPGDPGDLAVGMGGRDVEIRPFRLDIADLPEEGLIGRGIDGAIAMAAVPVVDFQLATRRAGRSAPGCQARNDG